MKKKAWLVSLLALMLVFSSACSKDGGSSTGTTDKPDDEGDKKVEEVETIKIGVLASLTGALESYGKQTQRGFELGLGVCDGWHDGSSR